jgi:hypothetical protein
MDEAQGYSGPQVCDKPKPLIDVFVVASAPPRHAIFTQ